MLITTLVVILLIVVIGVGAWRSYKNTHTIVDNKTRTFNNNNKKLNMEAAAEIFHPNQKIIPIDNIKNQLKNDNEKIKKEIKNELKKENQTNLEEFQKIHTKILKQIKEIKEDIRNIKNQNLIVDEQIKEVSKLKKQHQTILKAHEENQKEILQLQEKLERQEKLQREEKQHKEMRQKYLNSLRVIPKKTPKSELSLDQQLINIELTESKLQMSLFNELSTQLNEGLNALEQINTDLSTLELLINIETEFINTYNQHET